MVPRSVQRSQLSVCGGGSPDQAFFTLCAEKLQGRVDAVSLQGGCHGMAICIVVELPERFLSLAKILQRSLLLRKILVWKQVFECFDRIAKLLVHQSQPMALLGAHFQKLAALLQDLFFPPCQFVHAVYNDRCCALPRGLLSLPDGPWSSLDPIEHAFDQTPISGGAKRPSQVAMAVRTLLVPV